MKNQIENEIIPKSPKGDFNSLFISKKYLLTLVSWDQGWDILDAGTLRYHFYSFVSALFEEALLSQKTEYYFKSQVISEGEGLHCNPESRLIYGIQRLLSVVCSINLRQLTQFSIQIPKSEFAINQAGKEKLWYTQMNILRVRENDLRNTATMKS